MKQLIITSSIPGKRRVGKVFTGATAFEPDEFSEADLAAIIADPVLTVVAGEIVTDAKAFLKTAKAEAKATAKAGGGAA